VIGVEMLQEITLGRIRVGDREEIVIEPDFSRDCGGGIDPMDRALDLAAIRRIAAAGCGS
jgi:hypothetical protein